MKRVITQNEGRRTVTVVMDNSRDWAVTGVEEDRSGRWRGTMAEWPEEGGASNVWI